MRNVILYDQLSFVYSGLCDMLLNLNANVLSRNSHISDMLRDLRFSGQSCERQRLLGGDAKWPSMN